MINKFKLKKKQKNKKKKGFTLVELLAVIVILAVIMVITIPTVLGSMSGAKEKAEEIFVAEVRKALGKYIDYEMKVSLTSNNFIKSDKINEYDLYEIYKNDNTNITFNDLIEKGYIKERNFKNPRTDEQCDKNSKISIHKSKDSDEYYYYTNLECVNDIFNTLPIPIEPDLSTGLIPVIYDETKKQSTGWFVADTSKTWYDYFSQKWANAVLISSNKKDNYFKNGTYEVGKEISSSDWMAMFVWIPRFSYTIGCADLNNDNKINTNVSTSSTSTECLGYRIDGASKLSLSTPGAIDIKFVSVSHIDENSSPNYIYDIDTEGYPIKDRKPDKWLTHPAFAFDKKDILTRDKDEEIPGFWFAKFETTGSYATPTILPEMESFSTSLIKAIEMVNKFNDKSIYGINSAYDDIHVSKNSEWAAVAYLTQSVYGKYGNPFFTNGDKEVYNNDGYITGRSSGTTPRDSKNGESSTKGRYEYNSTNGTKGIGASTTGNVYGIYDMSGGRSENLMGNYKLLVGAMNDNTQFNSMSTWLSKSNNLKYLNIYDSKETQTIKQYGSDIRIQYTYNGSTLHSWVDVTTVGHGLFETYNWYDDTIMKSSDFSNSGYAWLKRGGDRANSYYNGIFGTSLGRGNNNFYEGFRITYIPSIR